MKTSDLQRRIPGLKRAVGKYKNLTDTNWLQKVYKDKFVVENGEVRLKNRPGSAPAKEGGSSSSRALPANYSSPALVFRGVVEVPKRTREEIQEAKRKAEAEKEAKRQERLMTWAGRQQQQQLKQLERMSRRSG